MHDTRVGSEFRGLARSFVQRLEPPAAEADRLQNSAARYVVGLQQRRPGRWHRPEHIIEVIRMWQAQPVAGSLMPPEVMRKPHSVSLRALRLVPSTVAREEWDGNELAITVSQFCLDIDRKGCTKSSGPLVALSQHALARRISRGFRLADDETIIADIRWLVPFFAKSGITEEHTDRTFTVPCADGSWRGAVRKVMSQGRQFIILDVRTFR